MTDLLGDDKEEEASEKKPAARKLKSVPSASITPSQRKLLDAAAIIWDEAASTKEAAFMARELVQCSLPHRNPGDIPAWSRKNGNVILGIQPGFNYQTGESYGYPYGTIPRLLLYWIITESARTKSRRLELGNSLNGFIADLGLNPDTGGGKRGDAKRLRDQMERLFNCRITFSRSDKNSERERETSRDMLVTEDKDLWWSADKPEQGVLWGSWIELGEKFFEAVTAGPVPIDMRALRALKKSPLALDLYAWLAYEAFRAHKNSKARFETWDQLHAHIGGEYAHIQHFRAKVKSALTKILVVYPALKLGPKLGGIEVLPESFPALAPRTIDGEWTTL